MSALRPRNFRTLANRIIDLGDARAVHLARNDEVDGRVAVRQAAIRQPAQRLLHERVGHVVVRVPRRPVVAEFDPIPISAFGTERTLALTRTSIFGTVYAASPRTDVIHGSSTWPGLQLLIDDERAYGQDQQLRQRLHERARCPRTPRPVLVPAWNITPLASRAFRLVVTPCQYWVRAGAKSVSNVW